MEGARTVVLPSNRDAADFYFSAAWTSIHTLTAAILSLYSGSSNDSEKFNSYIEAEEARLGNNLRAVNYVIDGIDTLTLITGVGRIEKVRKCTLYHPRLIQLFIDPVSTVLPAAEAPL